MVTGTFGPYEIADAIGKGGMGEVYRARDTNLNRDVAIKMLPETFASDASRVARFEQEAKTLATLNHPNIAHIYGLERSSGKIAIVMELVEGPTLADRIAQGPIPADEAMNIAMQIADALEAAHERGVVHRDLKPANVKVRPDGTVKVLDFGIAKAFDPLLATSGGQSPIMTTPATQAGVILGTAAYMSPEQARGRPVDKRTDIWAFGCVLYEMLTGQLAFGGEDVAETLARVIANETDMDSLPGAISPAVQRTLVLCLQKDVKKRIRDIGDVKLALAGRFDTGAASRPGAESTAGPVRKAAFAISAGVLGGAMTMALAAWVLLRPEPSPLVRLTITHPDAETVGLNEFDANIAISRDGRFVAYATGASASVAGSGAIYLRALDALSPTLIAPLGRTPFFSPDGEWVGFVAANRDFQRTATGGGPALAIGGLAEGTRGADWGTDNSIVFATNDPSSGLMRIAAAGSELEVLTKPDSTIGETDHLFPRFLPGGRHVLFTVANDGGVVSSQIALLDLQTREYRVLIQGGGDAHYAPSGHIVYGASGNLLAAPFDLDALAVGGSSVPVVEGVVTKSTGAASFGVADNGTLVYIAGIGEDTIRRTLVWVSREGVEEPIPVPPRNYNYAQVSPDGRRIALDIRDDENDIWIFDLERASLQRLTFDPGFNRGVVWSPDGTRIAFSRSIDGREEIYWQAWDGSGVSEPLTQGSDRPVLPSDISGDGQFLFFSNSNLPRDVLTASIGGGAGPGSIVLGGAASEEAATLSPDGRWLAFQSGESGQYEIYVRPFPDVASGRWQISTAGGTRPRWSRSGKELFYFVGDAGTGGLMTVAVDSDSGFRPGTPRRLIQGQYEAPNTARQVYDVSPDDQRFLMIKRAQGDAAETQPQIVVVLNWLEELKRLVPVD
jgi:serine/threonine-protein kinase